MGEILKISNHSSFDPFSAYEQLIISLAHQIAEKSLEALEEKNRDIWLTQQELMNKEDMSFQEVKRMERYGLKHWKKGKYKMYCLADVNEIKHLMKR